ncbi:MAG: phenylalanyl-tRNA synthetase beta chain [Parcubacteria bacterium C7867-008]|nr:MAG: phenylalanyl-tRNA synthetase beta chain [Parcubacteria bacterium C7867-008]
MKTSPAWLQKYFDEPLPSPEELADALTFNVAEIEEIMPTYIDVNVLPDRAAYLLSHRGVAYELSAILDRPMKEDPLRTLLPLWPTTDKLTITIDTDKSARQMGALVRGVKVGPSPEWLKNALESIGQRSINNIVDITNYVTFNMGQPLHAFDASKIQKTTNGTLAVRIRELDSEEKITVLTGEEYLLPVGTIVIAEAETGTPLDIAGIKGGMASSIDEHTTDLYVSAANFDGSSIRRTAQALKLFTDASSRFQNKPSPELVAYGMNEALVLIEQVAGGELIGVVDVYPNPQDNPMVSVPLSQINGMLGTAYTADDVVGALKRLGLPYTLTSEVFTVMPPFERRDIVLPEDFVEEVGRILGYDKIESTPFTDGIQPDNLRYKGIERIKDFLLERGYMEISTQSFAVTGDIYLANPLDMTKPALRTTLAENMRAALSRSVNVAPIALGPDSMIKLFEIGTVFPKQGESLSLVLGYQQLTGKKTDTVLGELAEALGSELGLHVSILDVNVAEVDLSAIDLEALGRDYWPQKVVLGDYRQFSAYPFALRDVAVWVPEDTQESEVALLIEQEADELLARIDRFDRFEKDGRTSYAFRLVFQANDRTLADTDLDPIMQRVTNILNAQRDWEVR